MVQVGPGRRTGTGSSPLFLPYLLLTTSCPGLAHTWHLDEGTKGQWGARGCPHSSTPLRDAGRGPLVSPVKMLLPCSVSPLT